MKKARKALLTLCAALLLVTMTAGVTIAYLTDYDDVTNTFTVGKVDISMDEKDTDDSTANKDRDQENEYKLMPGHSYEKDPTIKVANNSEDCFLYVKVQNDLATIELGDTVADGQYKSIATQMRELGWEKIGDTDVYYATQGEGDSKTSVFKAGETKDVFKGFTLTGNVTEETLATYATAKDADTNEPIEGAKLIAVTAYAIQADGFNGDAAAAWNANAVTNSKFN